MQIRLYGLQASSYKTYLLLLGIRGWELYFYYQQIFSLMRWIGRKKNYSSRWKNPIYHYWTKRYPNSFQLQTFLPTFLHPRVKYLGLRYTALPFIPPRVPHNEWPIHQFMQQLNLRPFECDEHKGDAINLYIDLIEKGKGIRPFPFLFCASIQTPPN